MDTEDRYQNERDWMVKNTIAARGVRDPRVMSAISELPRHLFIPEGDREDAYADHPLPVGCGQTISQPYIVALMTELLHLSGDEKVLEVGTGSGYQAALLGMLAKDVHTIEQHAELSGRAKKVIKVLKLGNIHFHTGDGSLGLPAEAPFDGIIVTAGAPLIPQPLLDQLADGGRLVIPVGSRFSQDLQLWWRDGKEFNSESICPVVFVPLRGQHGWDGEKPGDLTREDYP
jgi:protein-L-isoaspartate(D-aspartate) O-methyltransferase